MSLDYDEMKLEDLKDLCKERGLKTSGNKDELVARLELSDLEKEEGGDDASTDVEGGDSDSQSGDSDSDDGDDPDGDDDPAGGAPAPEDPEETDARGVETTNPPAPGNTLAAQEKVEPVEEAEPEPTPAYEPETGWRRGKRKGRLKEPEPTPVAPIRGSTSQEGADVKGAFQFAVLPDGRRVPIQSAREEGEE